MSAPYKPVPFVQNTPAWIDARRDHVGSSDISILTGNNPYRTSRFDLWAYKTRRIEAAEIDPMTQELFDLGHALEPVIAERYMAQTGTRVRRVNRMLESKAEPWASASLDRVDAAKGAHKIVEVKWVPWRRWLEGPEAVPSYVQDQVQWQLLVTGYDVADVAVLNGSHIDHHTVEPDTSYQADLLFIAREFYEKHLVGGEQPELDGSEATRKALLRLYPNDDGVVMDPTAELHALMGELYEAMPMAKSAAERVDLLKNAIRGALGEHAGSESDRWKVSHKLSKGATRTDWKAVAAAYRAALESYALPAGYCDAIEAEATETTEGSRRLLTTWKGTEEGTWS